MHERSLTCDFLLAVLKAVVQARPSLKLILMSATIDVCVVVVGGGYWNRWVYVVRGWKVFEQTGVYGVCWGGGCTGVLSLAQDLFSRHLILFLIEAFSLA